MGLMMSILIGCVGVLELLACLRHVADGVVIRINQPATPCLSYHEPSDNVSTHDSICSYSHSTDVNLPRGAKRKLENLHEYSLRIRTELRRLDKSFDYSRPLSECSVKDFLLPARASPDSRLSPDFEYLVRASSDSTRDDGAEANESNDYKEMRYERETSYEDAADNWRSSRDRPLSVIAPPEPERYVRVPTPIPFGVDDEPSSSGASSDVGTSFDNDSGNEAPTMSSFDSIPLIRRYKTPSEEGGSSIDESDDNDRHARHPRKPKIGKSHSKSPEAIADRTENLRETETTEKLDAPGEVQGESSARGTSQRKKIKSSSTIVRKPTRLKSKDAQVSKSAENLTARKSKKQRDPQRRKSDISVQTSSHLRDEWTNTSPPPGSPVFALSRSESRRSVSVQVQTNLQDLEQLSPCLDGTMEQMLFESSAVGLSESRRDLTTRDRFGRRTFKSRRFGSRSRDKADDDNDDDDDDDDDYSMSNATPSVERRKDEARLLKISSFEEADDEDYQRIRDILTEPESRECNERERRKGSRTASSFEDEEYWDAEDVSAETGPIHYTIPDPDRNKAFWVMTQPTKSPPRCLSPMHTR